MPSTETERHLAQLSDEMMSSESCGLMDQANAKVHSSGSKFPAGRLPPSASILTTYQALATYWKVEPEWPR